MADVNEIYKSNSDNIKAEDIGDNMWTMTIKSADVKAFDNGNERKIVLSFHEWDKNLPLNVTNARTIAGLYGADSNAWVGKQIMLFTMMVDYQGKQTLGIRVRAPMQPGGPQPGGYNATQHSPQRPLNGPQGYAQASGGGMPTGQFAPPPNGPEDYQ